MHLFDNQLAKLVNLSSLFVSNFSNVVNNFSKFLLNDFVVGIYLPFVVGTHFSESFHLFLCVYMVLLHHSVCTVIKRILELTKRKGTQIKEQRQILSAHYVPSFQHQSSSGILVSFFSQLQLISQNLQVYDLSRLCSEHLQFSRKRVKVFA